MVVSGGFALVGSTRVADDCAIVGYVGLVVVVLGWISVLVTARVGTRLDAEVKPGGIGGSRTGSKPM